VAVVLYVVATVLLAVIARPLWQPLVLAVVLAAPLASVNDRAARALGGRRTLAAALFTTGAILIIVLPIAAAALFVVDQAIDLANVVKTTLKQSGVAGLLEPLPDSIAQWLQHLQTQVPTRPREILSRVNGWSQSGWALGAVAGLLSGLSHLLFSFLMMVVALFFLLRDGHALQAWLKTKSPIGADNVDRLGHELSAVSKSVIGGNLANGNHRPPDHRAAGVAGARVVGAVSRRLDGDRRRPDRQLAAPGADARADQPAGLAGLLFVDGRRAGVRRDGPGGGAAGAGLLPGDERGDPPSQGA
jgi:hypothetical protein